jgi:hypothetical protein
MIHSAAARRWLTERRTRQIRRFFYRLQDDGKLWWVMYSGVVTVALMFFLVFHK